MSDNVSVLKLLIKNADKAAEFEAIVESAGKNKGKEFFIQNAIDASDFVGLKPIDSTSAPMQCSYGL